MKFPYQYINIDRGESFPQDACDFESTSRPEEPHYVAVDAAECEWNEHDGWEATWPQTLRIFAMGACIGTFVVGMEAVPNFFVEREET